MVRTQIIAFTDNLWWGPGTQFIIIIISVKKKKEKKRKKREEKRTRKRKEKERKKTKQAKEEDHRKLFFVIFFILIKQIGGNLDSSVDIASNQDVDISVSISLGPRSALWENGAKIGVGEKKR